MIRKGCVMKRQRFTKNILIMGLICSTILLGSRYGSTNGSIYVETFQNYFRTPFPRWKMRKNSPSTAARIYSIKSEGKNKYLHASTAKNSDLSIQIVKVLKWNIWKKPVLSWKWRAHQLPFGANELNKKTNDSAAAIYVIFQRSWSPSRNWKKKPVNVLKYIWSTSLPKGKVVHQRARKKYGVTYYEGNFYVLQSGNRNLGKWITERRNVLQDYKRAFGKKPRYNPMAIGILTDSNAVKKTAVADYDDIILE